MVCIMGWDTYVSLCASHTSRSPERPEEDVRYPGPGVTGSCEPPHMGAGTRLQSSDRTGAFLHPNLAFETESHWNLELAF